MNFKMINTVISREYTTRVKKKSFLVTTFLVPILFAALCCIPALIMMFSKDETKTIAVVDRSGLVMPVLESNDEIYYEDCSKYCLDSLKEQFFDLEFSAILSISEINEDRSVDIATFSSKPVGMTVLEDIRGKAKQAVQDFRIEQYNIPGLKEIMEEVKPSIDVKTFTLKEDGSENIDETSVYMALSLGLGIIIFMFITMFGSSVMASVVEEKQSKVVEVLLSSVNSVDLMFGKILGVALVALTQFLLWIVLTAAIVGGVFGIVGKDKLMGIATDNTEVVSAMGGADISAAAGIDAASLAESAQQPDKIQVVMQTFSNINIPEILLYFLLFFIFGYLLYASMFAAIGSAVENTEDSNQLQLPLTIPLMLGYFMAIYSWNAPDSALAVWGSMIPFTSPIVMLARIPFGVPVWQVGLSLILLVLTFALMAYVSAKIYRVGILTSGKKATFKDLYKWLKQK